MKPQKTGSRDDIKQDRQLLAIVQAFDQRLLAATDQTLGEQEKEKLLLWAHHQLIAVVLHLLHADSATPGSTRSWHLPDEALYPTLESVDVLAWLAAGVVHVGTGLEFCGVADTVSQEEQRMLTAATCQMLAAPTSPTLASRLVKHYHDRYVLAAQRTRFHSETELRALLRTADTDLILCALRLFNVAPALKARLPAREVLQIHAQIVAGVLGGLLNVAWTPRGPVFPAPKNRRTVAQPGKN